MQNYVWLVVVDPTNEQEHHMKWDGHTTKDAAEKEFSLIKDMIRCNGGRYPNTYIYESAQPINGAVEEVFDLSLLDAFSNILQ
jgi:hypothetical protein